MPINLGSGAISAAKVGSTDVAKIMLGSTEVYAAGGGGITPNNDVRARFYLPNATTSFSACLGTTTGYWRMTDGTTTSSVFGNGTRPISPTLYVSYYADVNRHLGTMSSLGSGEKVIQAYSCDSSGNASGAIMGVSLGPNSSDVTAVDLSGIVQLVAAALFSSTSYSGNYVISGGKPNSSQPSSITEVRAVGVKIDYSNGGPYGSPNIYYPHGGIDISGQQLDATALDQFYTDLTTSSASYDNELFVRGNPGTSGDTPSIATAKNYTVFGS